MFNKKTNESTAEKPSDIHIEESDPKLENGGDYSGAVAKTDPKEIALVKKLDIRIMGILWAMYFLVCRILLHWQEASRKLLPWRSTSISVADEVQNYLDRNAIAQARLNNLEDDLGLVGTQYNTCISILFVG